MRIERVVSLYIAAPGTRGWRRLDPHGRRGEAVAGTGRPLTAPARRSDNAASLWRHRMLTREQVAPNDLEAFWMPFTANRHFKAHPRLISRAEGMHYVMTDGRRLLDATAGLWCCNAGHAAPRVVAAIQAQAAELDFAPSFQWGHPKSFALASQLAHLFPGDLDHAFFTNSGSESVDTALKIALAYQRAIG